jgi:alpha-tubulin suppressor-like RCC1 family protein
MREKLFAVVFLITLLGSTLVGCGQGSVTPSPLAILSAAAGDVSVMKGSAGSWAGAQVGISLKTGDGVKTGDSSTAEITFLDGSTIELEANTEIHILSLEISSETGSKTITLSQIIGDTISRVTHLVDPESRYEIDTPTGVAGVRGSVMLVHVGEDGTTVVTNLEGEVYAVAQGVEVDIPVGQSYIITPGQPPKPTMMIAAGDFHTVGLSSDFTVLATGLNDDEQCNVGDWTDITYVAAAYSHTVGVKANGTVVAVGWNGDGECDVGGWTGITQVAAGYYHTVGLKADGTVVTTGDNAYGQRDVGAWTDIVRVAAGRYHTVGVKSDGTVVAVGLDESGQCAVGDWTDIVQVAAGHYHTVGIRSDGTAVAAGANPLGECDVAEWAGIIRVAAGEQHTVGLRGDGTLVTAGDNAYGQCDVGAWNLG